MAAQGDRFALMLQPVLADPRKLDNYVAACQLGITASSLLLGFYGQSAIGDMVRPVLADMGYFQKGAAESIAAVGVILFLTTLQVLLGELVPKSVGVRFPERLALLTVVPMRWSVAILRPLIWLFNGTGRLILRLLRVTPAGKVHTVHLPEEIELLVAESARGGLLDDLERIMLRNVFRLSSLVAHQVMLPRPRIVAAPAGTAPRQLLTLIADSSYTRIPIFKGDIDHILGMVHLKDIFRACFAGPNHQVGLEDVLREVPFVPETMPVDELWNLLRLGHHYMAIVFDEYGGTAGLITQEDLIEEVFGELQDEFDQESPLITRDPGGDVVLRGDVLVADVNEYLLLNLPTDLSNTIGGLVTSVLRRPARVGDEVTVGSHTLRVRQVDELAVTGVSLALPDDAEPFLDGERAGIA